MKGGSKLFVFAGVGLALVAILLLVMNLQGGGEADGEETTAATKVTVVQAKGELAAYTVITATDLVEIEVDAASASPDAATSTSEVIGMAYRMPLTIGQTVMRANLVTPGLRNDITTGMRAMALPINEVSSLSGLIQDGDYIDLVFHARIDLVPTADIEVTVATENASENPSDENSENPSNDDSDPEQPDLPLVGEPGSEFFIRDDVGESGELEAIAKIMLQDIKVIRVVRPGDQYQPDGSRANDGVTEGAMATQSASAGQIIIEVTPEQAELVTFIQDNRHTYQVVIRGKDDHTKVSTTGITYEILATDADWALPWPKAIVAPDEDENSAESGDEVDAETDQADQGSEDQDNAEPDASPEAS